MKVIYLATEDMSKEGGGKTHFLEITQNLQKLGNKLVVILPKYFGCDKQDYGLNIKYIPTFKKNSFSYLLFEVLRIFYLIFYILTTNPDVIYARSGVLDAMPPIISKIFGIPYFIEKNGVIEDEFKTRGYSRIIIMFVKFCEKINLKFCNKVICVTKGIKKELSKRYNINKNKFEVIPNGANMKLFFPSDKNICRKKNLIPDDKFIVGFVGSFAPWQGLDFLIDSINKIKLQGYSDILYILVGDGEMMQKLRKKVTKYNLENDIIFTGKIPYSKVGIYINSFDIAIAPFTTKGSSALGSPLKLFEYLSCQKPLISSDVDGVTEIIKEGNCGLLYEAGNINQLSKQIIFAYNNRTQLLNMGKNGRKLIEKKYGWNKIAMKLEFTIKSNLKLTNL